MPSASACTWIGVPCSSVPLTIRTWWPAIRMYRLNTSEGTPKPDTWPMCRGPLAYGHATAVRMWRDMRPAYGRRATRICRLGSAELGQTSLELADGLDDALLVLDEGEPHVPVTGGAEADAR